MRMFRFITATFLSVVTIVAFNVSAYAEDDAQPTKLLRYPDVYQDQVAFCYAGDIWKSDFDGRNVVRVTAHQGLEEFPKFSPDGKYIAFTGQYDGADQVYVVPSEGGEPKRLTYYPTVAGAPGMFGIGIAAEAKTSSWTCFLT